MRGNDSTRTRVTSLPHDAFRPTHFGRSEDETRMPEGREMNRPAADHAGKGQDRDDYQQGARTLVFFDARPS